MKKLSLPPIPFEKVAALSRLHRILICVGMFVILGGAFFYLIYMPKSKKINELNQEYENLEIKLTRARAAARNLNKFKKEYKQVQARFQFAVQLLPDKKEIPSLLEGISKSGKDSGLEFILFQPGGEVVKDFYAEIPVNIEVKGGYHHLAMFFDRVGRLPRIVNILNIDIKAPREGRGNLSASCVAMTYRFLDAAEIEAAAKEPKK